MLLIPNANMSGKENFWGIFLPPLFFLYTVFCLLYLNTNIFSIYTKLLKFGLL